MKIRTSNAFIKILFVVLHTALLLQKTYTSTSATITALPASYSQTHMVYEAQRICNIREYIRVFSLPKYAEGFMGLTGIVRAADGKEQFAIVLSSNPDFDHRLMIIYHEMGHMIHRDVIPEHMEHRNKISIQELFSEEPEFRDDLVEIQEYIQTGLNAFDTNTELGQLVHTIKQRELISWALPIDPQTRVQTVIKRIIEQRADLFAMRKMLEHRRLGPILNYLFTFKPEHEHDLERIRGTEDDEHPSHFERLLCIAGFLAQQGFDLNGLIASWEKNGLCFSSDQLYTTLNTNNSEKTNLKSVPDEDWFWFKRILYHQKNLPRTTSCKKIGVSQESSSKTYELFCQETHAWWSALKLDSSAKQYELATDILASKHISGQELWWRYLLLKELTSTSTQNITTHDFESTIDRNWVVNTGYQAFKTQKKHDQKQHDFMSEKYFLNIITDCLRMAATFNYNLDISSFAEIDIIKIHTFWQYNFLRESFELKPIERPIDFDIEWLVLFGQKLLKDEIYKNWQAEKTREDEKFSQILFALKYHLSLSDMTSKVHAYWYYNIARELANQRTINFFESLDMHWINSLEKK